MKKLVMLIGLAGLWDLSSAAVAQEDKVCGDVTVAAFNWQSAEFLASLDKFVLETGYGCNVSIIPGVPPSIFTSMVEKGAPDVAPESWITTFPEILNPALDDKRLLLLGKSLTDGGQQGWYIPKYTAEAHPEIRTIADALDHPEIFPFDEDPAKGAVLNGPQGYGGATVTTQIFKAYGAQEKNFVLVDTGSAAGLDGAISRAYERRQPILAYYWEPTSLLGRYEMVRLDGGAHDTGEWRRCTSVITCSDPKPNNWAVDDVYSAVVASFSERAPSEVLDYLGKRALDNKTLNGFLAWMSENQATGDEGARYFLQNGQSVWRQWVSERAAEKIEAGL